MADDSRSPSDTKATLLQDEDGLTPINALASALTIAGAGLGEFTKALRLHALPVRLEPLRLFEALRQHIDKALDDPVQAAHRNPEFVAVWQLFKELKKRDPDAYAELGKMTPRQLYQIRKALRLPPRPRGRPAGKRQQDIEDALAALGAGQAVPGPRPRRKYVRMLHRSAAKGE